MTTTDDQPDYMQEYERFWKEIVEHPDGTLNRDQIARELADALTLQRHLSEIYSEVSSGQVSKPFTLPSVVTAMYHDGLTEVRDEAIRELIEELEDRETDPQIVAVIREITGVQAPPNRLAG